MESEFAGIAQLLKVIEMFRDAATRQYGFANWLVELYLPRRMNDRGLQVFPGQSKIDCTPCGERLNGVQAATKSRTMSVGVGVSAAAVVKT